MRVGILTEFPSPTVQTGPSIHTRFLQRGLEGRGHQVVLMGPNTDKASPVDGVAKHLYYAVPYGTHPDVVIPLPGPMSTLLNAPQVDIIHGQANTHMIEYGAWMRKMYGIPVLNTNTIHFPSHSHFLLSDRLYNNTLVREWWRARSRGMERMFARIYNEGDCLIVQSRHFVDYWREQGVTIPIEVVGRPINPTVFSRQPGPDPFPAHFRVGKRLLVVCRHDREKSLDHLLDLFARHLAPQDPEVTLTLVGDGHDHANLYEKARQTGYFDRICMPGEAKHEQLVDYYCHADVFVYTSVSETFGNVVNEALWTGLPVVALDDRMGVAHQVLHEVNGFLIEPGRVDTDRRFAESVQLLVDYRGLRRQLGESAANLSRRTSHPDVVLGRFENIYEEARRHCREHVTVPLAQKSLFAQAKAFAKHVGTWALWNTALVTMGAMAALGASKRGPATQHDEVVRRYESVEPGRIEVPAQLAA